MNALTKHSIYAAMFPYLDELVEVSIDGTKVFFTLRSGAIFLECSMNAEEVADSYAENFINSDPQNEVDVSYTRLEVDAATLVVIRGEFGLEVSEGMQFQLTNAQIEMINNELQEHCIAANKKNAEEQLQAQINDYWADQCYGMGA